MRWRKNWGTIFALLTLGSAVTPAALAQSDAELFQQFQFNFSPPGARASGMGRTFIGLANDGTASISNPAGLMQLGNMEVYFEYKHTDLDTQRLAAVDSLFTLEPNTFGEATDMFSFFSFTKRVHERVAVGFSFHQFLNIEEEFFLQPRAAPSLPVPGLPNRFSGFFPVEGEFDMEGVSYAGSIAFNLATGLNIGFTVAVEELESQSSSTRLDFTTSLPGIDPNNPADVTVTEDVRNRVLVTDSDTSVSVTIGGLYDIRDGLSVGGVYSHGSSFDLQTFALDFTGGGTIVQDGFPTDVTINVPDRFGAGFQVSPTRLAGIDSYSLTLAFDFVRVEYSDLLDDFTPIFTSGQDQPLTADNFEIDDAEEVHFGGELGFPFFTDHSIFLRGGVFTNPEHRQRFLGNADNPVINMIFNDFFQSFDDDTEYGWTVGGGLVISNRVKIDAAWVDIDSFQEFVTSVAFAFQ